jgi:hypothetical protein
MDASSIGETDYKYENVCNQRLYSLVVERYVWNIVVRVQFAVESRFHSLVVERYVRIIVVRVQFTVESSLHSSVVEHAIEARET